MKKYKLGKLEYVDKTRWLYRIIALKNFADVKKGDIGGFIKSENNLSHRNRARKPTISIVGGIAFYFSFVQATCTHTTECGII